MTTELKTTLRALAAAQRAEAAAIQETDTAAAAVKVTPAGRAWEAARAAQVAARQAVIESEREARAAILAAYEATGDKHPAPGAGVRVTKSGLALTDTALAISWAEEHMPTAVIKSVDADLLAAWAARQPELPAWMTRTPDKATPTIAKNLAELYPEADDAHH